MSRHNFRNNHWRFYFFQQNEEKYCFDSFTHKIFELSDELFVYGVSIDGYFDFIGFDEITNENLMSSIRAGCDTIWLNSQYEHTNGDYINPMSVEAEKQRLEASSCYGRNNSYSGSTYNGGSYIGCYSGK